jgi:anti-sigma factor RsiW
MACERHKDALSDAAAGGGAPAPELEAHLASCEACRGELEGLRGALATADRELARLLSAVPSPELPPRIRAAVAGSTPAAQGWRPGIGLALVGAAAALLVAVLLVWQRHVPPPVITVETKPSPSPGRGSETPAPVLGRNQSAAPAPAGERTPPVTASVSSDRSRRARNTVSEPEVLVPPGELEALLRYAANLRRRTLAPDALLVADHSVPLPEPRYAAIQPLAIVPLDPDESAGSE